MIHLNDMIATFHSLANLDKDTMIALGHALFYYIIWDGTTHKSHRYAKSRYR